MEPVLALMLDGVHLADNLYALIAVGVYADGHKAVLGFRIGSSENIEVSRDLVAALHLRSILNVSKKPITYQLEPPRVLTTNGTPPFIQKVAD